MAMSSDGSMATAVWIDGTAGHNVIKTASATIAGRVGSWGVTQTLIDPIDHDAEAPDIALSADGTKATVVWDVAHNSNVDVSASSATIVGNVATWSEPTLIGPQIGNLSPHPDVALSADGTTAVVAYRTSVSNYSGLVTKAAKIVGNVATWESESHDLTAVNGR